MGVTPGKLWGLRRLSDEGGRWKMVAIDQRTPVFGPIAERRGTATPPFEDVARVKSILARHLAPRASAILIDPIYGYEVSIAEIPARRGLMIAYEHSESDSSAGGRKTVPIPGWTMGHIKRIGGDAAKVLAWYRADAPEEVRRHQESFVEEAGRLCAEADLVMLLEVLVYPLPGESQEAFAAKREALVLDSVRPFLDPKFGVDIYKLEPPGSVRGVPDPDGPDAGRLQAAYDRMVRDLPRPWVLLSAGAGGEDFERSLRYAYRAGASGYLAGRAFWWDAFQRFPDFDAMEASLAEEGGPYMDKTNELTDRLARPWTEHQAFASVLLPKPVRPDFLDGYVRAAA
jgi:tagatose 1,6-diphosphate aldolase